MKCRKERSLLLLPALLPKVVHYYFSLCLCFGTSAQRRRARGNGVRSGACRTARGVRVRARRARATTPTDYVLLSRENSVNICF